MKQKQQRLKQLLATQAQLLQSVSPLSVLARGYAITQTVDGQVLRSYQDASVGSVVLTQLKEGWISAQVLQNSLEKPEH